MPRISRIRIVGNKYDNFKKCHDNTILDLTRGEEPDHTLFTLNNGSGKGVLMQLISQIVLPNTRWGKNNGNKVSGMFLNRNNQFSPYTFHVILEWKLDTVPEKWLITGICFTAVKKSSDGEEDDEKIGVKYFLYTHEHYRQGYYSAENIPVYLKDEGKTVKYEDFERFLSENKKDFRKFSSSQSKNINSEYYRYLGGYGIYRSEWNILKLINKVEGGVGEYFSKAKDNKGIFDEYIIPVITENLNNQFEENKNVLKDMFRSNISLTKNLPVLINREADYKNLSIMLEPLIRDAQMGINYEKRRGKCITEGNNLYCILIGSENNILNEIKKWEMEKDTAEAKKAELLYKTDNLEYAKCTADKREYENKKYETEADLNCIKSDIDELKAEKKRFEINSLLIPLDLEKKKKQSKINELEILIKSSKLKDTEEEKEKIEGQIKESWAFTRANFIKIENEHKYYGKFLNTRKSEFENEIKNMEKSQNKFKVKIGIIEEKKKDFNERKKLLSKEFDNFHIENLQFIMDNAKDNLKAEDKILSGLQRDGEKLENNIGQLKIDTVRLDSRLSNYRDKKADIEKKYNVQSKFEEELFFKILDICKLDSNTESYSEMWLQDKGFEIKKLMEENKLKLKDLYEELWENNIDFSLNTKEYWIPNGDIVNIKSKIDKLGVKVIYGNQFLLSLASEEDRMRYLKNYPELPFGIVIANMDAWKIIQNNISKDIFMRSMVPVYIRTDMKNDIVPSNYKVVDHIGMKFIKDKGEFHIWRENLSEKELKIKETEKIIDSSITKMNKIVNDIDVMLMSESSASLKGRLHEFNVDIEKCSGKLSLTKAQIANMEEKSKLYKHDIKEKIKDIDKLNSKIEKLQNFMEFKTEMDGELIREKEYGEKLDSLELGISQVEIKKEGICQRIDTERKKYGSWKLECKDELKLIGEIIKNLELDDLVGSENYESNIEPDYEIFFEDNIFSLLDYRSQIENDIEQKNYVIGNIRENIKEIEVRMDSYIENLREMDADFESYRLQNISVEVVKIKLNELVKNLDIKQKLYFKNQGYVDNIRGHIDALNKELSGKEKKILKDHHKAPEPWNDLNLVEVEFKLKSDMEDNDRYLKQVQDILKEQQDKKININSLIFQIKYYEELDPSKGRASEYSIDQINGNEKNSVEKWVQDFKFVNGTIKSHEVESQKNFEDFVSMLDKNINDGILKSKIKEIVGDKINIANFKNNKDSFESIKDHAGKEINRLGSDKLQAEQAKEQWSSRAAMQVIKISECLKEMVNKMVYINQNGYAFKLVKLKGEEYLPKDENDIKPLLDEYFLECIEKLNDEVVDFDNLQDKILNKFMSDRVIFSKVLRGKYPELQVYKMTEKNEFLYAKPRSYHYATWGAVNGGEGDSPEGSGGQSLSINTFVIMMLMNYKKKTPGNENPWTVLMLDNPFGRASGAHVLDPIFTIADKLNFQIIAFAAPEIIKTEISERFPVFWSLKINDEKEKGKVGSVLGRMVHGGRVIIDG